MAETVKDLGDTIRLSVQFSVGAVDTDPTDVSAVVKQPDGTTTSYEYNPGGIARDGTGAFHIDVVCVQAGEWSYKFVGTGTAADVGPGIFYVRPDPTASSPFLYVSVDALKESLSLTGQTNIDPLISRSIETASRAIDEACKRPFYPIGTDDDPSTRYFTGDPCSLRLSIGDTVSVTALTVDMDGDGVYETTWTQGTDFFLDPSDSAERSEPYTSIKIRRQSGKRFPTWERSVKMTGVFGWTQPPSAVMTFTEILAKRLISRSRDNNQVLGLVLTGNDLGSVTRLARTDPDFDVLLGPYVKIRQLVA